MSTVEPALASGEPVVVKRRRRAPETAALAVVLLVLILFFSTRSEFFFTTDNAVNILFSAAVIGIVAAPATLLMVAGQFDLSVGSAAALIGVVMAWGTMEYGIVQGIFLSILAGLAIGIVNGVCVTVFGINAFITTLAMLAILRGLAQVLADGQTLILPGFDGLGNARPIGDIPLPVFIFFAVMILMALVMRYTVYGRSMYAIGANAVAARLAGIKTRTAIFFGFILSSSAVVIAGLILVSQLGAASPQAATGLELTVVTAVILGGASLSGGRGTILGTLLGVLILGVLNNGMTIMNIDSFWQGVAKGVLLLVAVGFDQLRLRVSDR